MSQNLTNQLVLDLKLGFTSNDKSVITDSLTLDVGRGRYISYGDIGNPNEMLFLCEKDDQGTLMDVDVVVIHNYDYDGYMTKEKLLAIIRIFFMNNK